MFLTGDASSCKHKCTQVFLVIQRVLFELSGLHALLKGHALVRVLIFA